MPIFGVLFVRRALMKTLLYCIGFLVFLAAPVFGQTKPVLTRAILIEGDTVPIYVMNEVKIFGPIIFNNKTDAIKFSRLVKNVKKVYPYAKITGIKVREFEEIIKNAKNEKDRKAKMKIAEDELKGQFEDDVKNLTFKQGILLIKLIDRETGATSFELIKEFRGRFMASFYQTIGRLFGYNLKTTYDPEGEDKEVEKIVLMIENGAI
jgi:hypothetical protein